MRNIIIGVIILIVILVIISAGRESATGIRRRVGAYNTEGGQPADFRYTWTDGRRVYSCDSCPSKQMCPQCPQYRLSSIEGMSSGGGDSSSSISGGESPDPSSGKNLDTDHTDPASNHTDPAFEHTDALLSLQAPVKLLEVVQPEFRPDELAAFGLYPTNELSPAYDLDPEFVSSRARMGSCKVYSRTPRRVGEYDISSLGTHNDDLHDGERGVLPGVTCKKGLSSTRLLYNNVMGLSNPAPYDLSCEFIGPQGYLYKETCSRI